MATDKKLLRQAVKASVTAMDCELKKQASQEIVSLLNEQIHASGARVVALFSPLPDEPDISPLIASLSERFSIFLPRVEGDVMDFYPYLNGSMEQGAYGIMEPQGNVAIEPSEIDVMVVPGVAFTKAGTRMGRGKGYYDKYMSQEGFRACRIGVCYAVQMVDALPVERHDVTMDAVICR